MIADALPRFLGVTGDADAFRLLALTPGQRHPTAIQRGLESQLARVNRHPDANSSDADLVRGHLRAAAEALRAGLPFVVSPGTKQPGPVVDPPPRVNPPASAPAPPPEAWNPNRHGLNLTSFDRTVLAVLVACEGWNSRSRAKLVAMAARHNISPQGLTKVVTGLSAYARHGGKRFDVQAITGGAQRFEAPPVPPSQDTKVTDSWQEQLIPEITRGGPWATVKLSMLFAAITLMLGVLFVRLLMRTDSFPPRTSPPSITETTAAPQVQSPSVTPPIDDDHAPRRLVQYPRYPTFRGDRSPTPATDAADQSPRLPDLFDQLARKLAVSERPSAASHQDWKVYNEQAGLAWALMNDAILNAVRVKFIEVLFAAADRPSVTNDLLSTLASSAGTVHEPLDIWRGAWVSGMLGEIAVRADAPPVLRDQARRELSKVIAADLSEVGMSFRAAARAWLDRATADLVLRAIIPEQEYDAWELWIGAHTALGRGDDFEVSILDAIESMMRSPRDLAAPGPAADIVGRLLTLLDFQSSPQVQRRVVGFFNDEDIENRDLWALSTLLATSGAVPWFDEALVVSFDAPAAARRRVASLIADRWPTMTIDPAMETGSAITINARLGGRWKNLAEKRLVGARNLTLEPRPEVLLRILLEAAWINQAAASLAQQDVVAAQDSIEQIENGWTWSPRPSLGWSRNGVLRVPQTPPQPRGRGSGPKPVGPSIPLGGGIGQGISRVRGPDGVWAQVYEQSRRSTDQRMILLRELRATAGSDLGPIDAAVLVGAAYRSPTPEVREFAQIIVLELFQTGPNVAIELLDQLVDAPTRDATSDFITTVAGVLLPPVRSAQWRFEARVAMLDHVLSLFPTPWDEMDALAVAINDTYLDRLLLLRPEMANLARPRRPEVTIEKLVTAWKREASALVVTRPMALSLPGIERRHVTRLSLARGPIERAVAGQVTLLELLAYTANAEQPVLAEEVALVLTGAAFKRRDAGHILQQAVLTELAMTRLWLMRLTVPSGHARRPLPEEALDLNVQGAPRDTLATSSHVLERVVELVLLPGHHLAPQDADDEWIARLEALLPEDPNGYFTLAEEIADAAQLDRELDLARHLFRLAAVLGPVRFGHSAALALADLETNPKEKRRLLALATLLDRRVGQPNWLPMQEQVSVDRGSAASLSEILSVYRRGYGSRALNMLNQSEDAQRLLVAFGDALGGERRIRENMQRYRSGDLSPIKAEDELVRFLRVERALLAGDARTWGGELLLNRDRTLVEVDPSDLAASFHVDPARPFFRHGRWTPGEGTR